MRDIIKYTADYINMPFEKEQVKFRRKKVLEIIDLYKPNNILEIGCGMDSMANHYNHFVSFSIVEPSVSFYGKAVADVCKKSNVFIFNEYLEDFSKDHDKNFDFIIVSSLLHEVENRDKFIIKLKENATKDTVIHFNVPNARSFHRLLALEMGIIDDLFLRSDMQKKMQQNVIYDMESIVNFLQGHKFKILDFGSYFIKPFSHEQMQSIIDNKIFPSDLLDGLDKMISYMPNMGSEIFVNVSL